jgi:hypothetical protein
LWQKDHPFADLHDLNYPANNFIGPPWRFFLLSRLFLLGGFFMFFPPPTGGYRSYQVHTFKVLCKQINLNGGQYEPKHISYFEK